MTSLSAARRRWVLAIAALASFIVSLDGLVMATALNQIREQFGADLKALEWTINGYGLSFAVLLTVAAALGERFGRRRFFMMGIGTFVIASVLCALSANVGMLIAARVVQGAGAAFMMPLALAMLGAAFPPDIRGKALGTLGAVTGLAVLGGPVVGGAIAQGLDWTWIFWINVPIGLLMLPLALRHLDESRGSDTGMDLPGVALLAGAALGATWGLMRSVELGWTAAEVLACFAGAAMLVGLFVIRQRTAREPMLPPRLFAQRAFTGGIAATFLHFSALEGTLFFIAQFLQAGQGYGPLEAGLRLLPWTATLFVVAPLAGGLIGRTGERPLIVVGLLLQAVGLGIVALTVGPETGLLGLALPMVLAGVGASMAMPAMESATMGAVTQEQMGKATGAMGVGQALGGVAGIAIAATAFALMGTYGDAARFSTGFSAALWTTAALSLLGAMAATMIPGQRTAVTAAVAEAGAGAGE